MFTRLKITNFRSISEMELDLRYHEDLAINSDSASLTWSYLQAEGCQICGLSCLALFGANASGKSNIVQALCFIQRIIKQGDIVQDLKEYSASIFVNRLLSESKKSTFMLEFIIQGKAIRYELSLNIEEEGIIATETLSVDEEYYYCFNPEKSFIAPILFEGNYDQDRLQSIYEVECCSKRNEHRVQQRSFLHVLGRNYAGLNDIITECFAALTERLHIYPVIDIKLKSYMWLSDDQLNRVGLLMKQFDIGILDWKRLSSAEKFKVYRYNKSKDKKIEFDILEESYGTQALLDILSRAVLALDLGATIIIDEMDRSLHPLLLIEVVRLFKSKSYNPHQAQLIFTTHTTDILEEELLLTDGEVGIVSKTLKSGTYVRLASEERQLRNIDNLRLSYLVGELSGIPYPSL